MSKPEVRIVSDGTPWGTQVYVNDKLLTCAREVTWSAAPDEPVLATITVYGAELNATAELANIGFEELTS